MSLSTFALLVLPALLLTLLGLRLTLAAWRDKGAVEDRLAGLALVPLAGRPAPAADARAAYGPAAVISLFARANIALTRGRLAAALVAPALAGATAGLAAGAAFAVAAFVAVMLLQLAGLRYIAARRLAAFMADLPSFLEKIMQLVKIGNSLLQALERAVEVAPPRVQEYFAPAMRRIENGAGVDEALQWLAARIDTPELHMFAMAVEANLAYGGRINTMIGFLIQLLRDRQKIEREMQAASAESRITAWIIGCLPIGVSIIVWIQSPSYPAYFLKTPQGHLMLSVAVLFEAAGVLLLSLVLKGNER